MKLVLVAARVPLFSYYYVKDALAYDRDEVFLAHSQDASSITL
jgi:hypothetical protein